MEEVGELLEVDRAQLVAEVELLELDLEELLASRPYFNLSNAADDANGRQRHSVV